LTQIVLTYAWLQLRLLPMLTRKKIFFIMKLFGVIFLVALLAIIYVQSDKEQQLKPRPFPKIITQNFRKSLTIELPLAEQIKAKVTYVNFWALWCPPCLTEIPYMESMYQTFDGDNFKVLLLNVDNSGEKPKAKAFVKVNAPSLLAEFSNTNQLQTELQANRLPYHLVLDKKGRIAFEHYGNLDENWDDFKELILQLLKED